MKGSTCLGIAAICLFVSPSVALAQATEVTFRVPINVTHLMTDIDQVRVMCRVNSPAIVTRNESGQVVDYYFGYGTPVPVVDGRVVTTTAVVVPIPRLEDPAGKSASYWCSLQGRHRVTPNSTTFTFSQFIGNHSNVALRLSPAPNPLTGTFAWVDASAAPTAAAPPNVTTTSPGSNP